MSKETLKLMVNNPNINHEQFFEAAKKIEFMQELFLFAPRFKFLAKEDLLLRYGNRLITIRSMAIRKTKVMNTRNFTEG